MSDTELKSDLALADVIRDIAHAQEARRKRFVALVRLVRHREASGPSNDMMKQLRGSTKNSASCLSSMRISRKSLA
jgi:hypothetical protein